MFGFIYKDGGDYALRMGQKLHFLSDGISAIDEDVEIGNINEKNLVEGYGLSIDKIKKIWKIKDTGFHCCKKIIASGSYKDGFEESLKPIMKCFMK